MAFDAMVLGHLLGVRGGEENVADEGEPASAGCSFAWDSLIL